MRDPATRGPARVAALVALPAALVAGVLAYRVLDSGGPAAREATQQPRPSAASTGPVTLPASELAGRPAAVCRAFLAALPDHLGDLARRPVTAGREQNAAYGDPPVTLACGVPGPTPPPGAQFYEIERVCWYPEELPGRVVWSLRGYEVTAAVTVPEPHGGQYLTYLAEPITATVGRTQPTCA